MRDGGGKEKATGGDGVERGEIEETSAGGIILT